MSHTKVKTTYEEQGSYGSTEKRELYCHHNHSCDHMTFYTEDGEVALMSFGEWSSGKDLWDAMITLAFPFKDKWGGELKDGVEYYTVAPWEKPLKKN
jgi:hypothetical protein